MPESLPGEQGQVSNRELLEAVARLRLVLRADEQRAWVVASPHPADVLACLLAAEAEDAQLVLPPSLQLPTIEDVARASSAGVLSAVDGAPEHWRTLPGLAVPGAHPLDPLPSEGALKELSQALARDTAARLTLFTSGTSGHNRAFTKSGRQLCSEAEALAELFYSTPAPDGLSIGGAVPAHHIYGLLFGALLPWFGGVPWRPRMTRANDLDQRSAGDAAPTPIDLVSVPAQLAALSRTELLKRRVVRRVYSSGAPLPRDLAALLVSQGIEVCEVLGSTETGGIALRRDTEATYSPLPGVTLRSDTEDRLEVASPWLFPKHRPAAVMRTADRVTFDDARFVHLGRADDVIKIGGKRLALSSLEELARRCPGVEDAAALARPAPGLRGQQLCLAVAADPARLSREQLRTFLRQHLDATLLPRRLTVVARLPRTEHGKLPHDTLAQLFPEPFTVSGQEP